MSNIPKKIVFNQSTGEITIDGEKLDVLFSNYVNIGGLTKDDAMPSLNIELLAEEVTVISDNRFDQGEPNE